MHRAIGLVLHGCTSVIAFLIVLLPAAGAATGGLTIDALLRQPHISDFAALPQGGAVWVEVSAGASNLYVARPPSFDVVRLTDEDTDDGIALAIADVAPDGATLLIYRGGKPNAAGETPNPASLPNPTARELWMQPLDGRPPSRIDGGPGSPIDSATFAPAGNHVAYAKRNELWMFVSADGRPPVRLLSSRGTIRELAFSPDGRYLAFVTDRSRYGRGTYAFVGIHDLQQGALTWAEPGLGVDGSLAWSPDSRRIAFIRVGVEPKRYRFSDEREGPPFSLVVADAETGRGHAVWTAPLGRGSLFSGFEASLGAPRGGSRNLLWTADDRLVFPYEGSGWRLLYAVAAEGGEAACLTPGRFEVDSAALAPDRRTLLFAANSEADPHRLHLYRLDTRTGHEPDTLTDGDSIEWDPLAGDEPGLLMYRQAGAASAERLLLRRRNHGDIPLGTGPSPGSPHALRSIAGEIVTFTAPDGLRIPAVLYRPAGARAPRSTPAVVHAHGGSRDKVYPAWTSGFGPQMAIRRLVSEGYVVLSVNYRSGTGYGLEFREPPSYGARGAGDIQDFLAAYDWLTGHIDEVDPLRVAIFGHSYGGHIVSNVLARSDRYAAGIDSAGVGDWVVEMEMDSGGVLPFNVPMRQVIEAESYASSAISVIDQWGDEPLLLLHGDDDRSAALQQSIELYLGLQQRGKAVEAVVFPGEAHGLQLARHQRRYLEAIDSFLQRRL